MKRTYSTKQAADKAGIHWVTLLRWLASGKVKPSQAVPYDGRTLWRWTDADVKRLLKYKIAHYRKGRGRKKGKRSKT
jgi:predicted site-specific integrase-resolvase